MHPYQSSDFPSSFVILGEKTSFKREVTLFSSIEDLKDFFKKSYNLKTYQLVKCLQFLLPYSHLFFSESIGHRAQKLQSRQIAKWVVPPAIVGQTHSLIVYVRWAAPVCWAAGKDKWVYVEAALKEPAAQCGKH